MPPRINIPPLTRGLLLCLGVLTLLNFGMRYRKWTGASSAPPPDQQDVVPKYRVTDRLFYAPYLTIVPGVSVIYPWVFLTATVTEQNVVGLLITGCTLFYGGRYLERAWSSAEYAKYMLLISLIPNILCFLAYIMLFAVTMNPYLTSTAISGGISIQAAFLIAFKQLVPEHTISLFHSLLRIRVKHLPLLFLIANTVSGLAFGTDTAMLLAWTGFFTSWIYLRFFRLSPSVLSSGTGGAQEGTMLKGDASDTFAFQEFFPEPIHPPIALLADALYSTLTTLKILPRFSAEEVDASNEQATARGQSGLPSLLNPSSSGQGRGGGGGGRREEAERRRALALRALDQRLAQQGRPTTPTPIAPQLSRTESTGQLGQTQLNPDPPERPKSALEAAR